MYVGTYVYVCMYVCMCMYVYMCVCVCAWHVFRYVILIIACLYCAGFIMVY